MNYRTRKLLLLSTILLLLVACQQEEPTPLPEATTTSQETAATTAPPATAVPADSGYPEPEAGAENAEGYPVAPTRLTSIGYPPASATEVSAYPSAEEVRGGPAGPLFDLEPLEAGATSVSGTAPYDLDLAVMDVTLGGGVLGTGQSDAEGNFTITVPALVEGHRIGIAILSSDESASMESLATEYFPYRGDNFMNIPNIGVFFDTALVAP